MNDERILILQMLEKGKITVDEAVALLDALDPDSDRTEDAPSDSEPAENAATEGEAQTNEAGSEGSQSRVEERLRQLRESIRQKTPGPDEINSFVRTVQKGIAQVIDELPDVMNRLLHWEFRSNVAGHTFEETYSGTLAATDEVTIRIHNEDGPVRIFASDDESYHVRVVNRVRMDDEAQAKKLSQDITHWDATPSGFELTAKDHPRVSSQLHVALPLGLPYVAYVTSSDGSIVWDGVNGRSIRLNTDDGALKVTETAALTIHVHTSDGGISLRDVQADVVEALSADGSVRFDGFARTLRCKTSDGAVRATLMPLGPEPPSPGELSWELLSSDGSIAADVPVSEPYGYRLNLATSDGGVSVSLPGITTTTSGTGVFTGQTADFETKPLRASLSIRTADGSIRVGAIDRGGDQ